MLIRYDFGNDEEEVQLAPTAHALAVAVGTKSAVSVDS
jgi:hypothetical protein